MNSNEILNDISNKLSGNPEQDAKFLEDQAEKYKNHEEFTAINRGLAKMLYQHVSSDYINNLHAFLLQENIKVKNQLEEVTKYFENKQFDNGIKILEEIIKNNSVAWIDTDEYTYKTFGSPIEYYIYDQIFGDDREIKSVNCDLSEVYRLYGYGLIEKDKLGDAIKALETACSFNPVNPVVLLEYGEALKLKYDMNGYKKIIDRILQCAVTKQQLATAYQNYGYYYTERREFTKAVSLLEMSKIFSDRDVSHIDKELQYVTACLGRKLKKPTNNELLQLLKEEGIQAGPSALVIQTAYIIAKSAEEKLDYELAVMLYSVVYELLEDNEIYEHINELNKIIERS